LLSKSSIEAAQLTDQRCIRARSAYLKALHRTLEEVEMPSNDSETQAAIQKEAEDVDQDDGFEEGIYDIEDLPETDHIELPNGLMGIRRGRILLPDSLIGEVLERFHNDAFAGHLGTRKTLVRIKRRFVWPFMVKAIKEYVRSCELCSKRKACAGAKAPMVIVDPPTRILEKTAADILGPLTPSENNNTYILVIGDYLSRFVETIPMPNQTAETVLHAVIDQFILRYGKMEQIHTDQGTQFQSALFRNFCKQHEIKQTRSAPYRPNSDGMIEKFNRTIIDQIACFVKNNPSNWERYLRTCTHAYNTSEHHSTGETPFYLMFLRDARELNDVQSLPRNRNLTDESIVFAQHWHMARELAHERIKKAQLYQKKYHDRNTKLVSFKKGDIVLLKVMENVPGKFNMRYKGAYIVLERCTEVNYKIRSEKGKDKVVHVNHLKKMHVTAEREAEIRSTAQREYEERQNKLMLEKEKFEAKKPPVQHEYNLRKNINAPDRLRY